MSDNLARVFEFGPFILDTGQHVLRRGQEPIPLTPKTFDMLALLVMSRGRMLTKEELMRMLWPDSFVEESNLTQQISMPYAHKYANAITTDGMRPRTRCRS